jgi:protein-disulfide isomerase
MLKHHRELRLVLVPYPILGISSISAARVELAVAKLGTPEQFYEFHRKIYAQHGTTDGPRALDVAADLGLNKQNLLALGDSDQITGTMKNLVNLGTSLGLEATPSFIVGNLAILGYPGPHALQAMVSAVGTCGKAAC